MYFVYISRHMNTLYFVTDGVSLVFDIAYRPIAVAPEC